MGIAFEIAKLLPDWLYLKIKYRRDLGKSLNLKTPKSFNEKLQWLKLYDRNPLYTTLVDKYAVKLYVSQKIGSEYIIPTLGVWENFDSIDFNKLPSQFVLKTTHDSGGVVICSDRQRLDFEEAKKKITTSLHRNFYWDFREWPYKNVKPRIIAEQYLADNLLDYKLFCFNGVPRITLVCSERFSQGGLKEDFYDEQWNHLDLKRPNHENSRKLIPKPEQYDLLKALAETLSSGIPFARIDFYVVQSKVYFGEITFYPASGFEGFVPAEWDLRLGDWIQLIS